MRGQQKFFWTIEIGGFGMIARLPDSDTLAVINPIELTAGLRDELIVLEEETQSKVKLLISPGD
jgi:hypothetical protein